MNDERELSDDVRPGIEESAPTQDAPAGEEDSSGTRRGFLGASARKLAYVAPVVLLFKPKKALAASGVSGTS